ncbi:MAG: tetratricopeptide repeat protein [Saprospiraceae bacterium]
MKRIQTPTILFLLLLSFWQCQPDKKQPDQPSKPQSEAVPEATSLDGKPLYPVPESANTQRSRDSLLTLALRNYQLDSSRLENLIWVGRRLAYMNRYREAIDLYSRGIQKFPSAPELYRHRGHRYISTRQFDKAIADFEKAAELARTRPVEIEPDGIPNKLNKPLSSLQFNIWYHWALAYYLKGDFQRAAQLYEENMQYSTNPDLLCATVDWLYMTYRRLGETEKATKLLELIQPDMEIIENQSYFNRILLYKGLKKPEDLLQLNSTDPDARLGTVTQGYGVGNWHYYNGDTTLAKSIFQKVIDTGYWAAFGYVAAEADLVRMK